MDDNVTMKCTVLEATAQYLETVFRRYPEGSPELSTIKTATEVLRSYEPRLLSKEEAEKRVKDYRLIINRLRPVYVQFKDGTSSGNGMQYVIPWRNGPEQKQLLEHDGYGEWFVFWTDRPTDEMMAAVEWLPERNHSRETDGDQIEGQIAVEDFL